MKKLILMCIVLLLLISQAGNVFAQKGNISKGIERVEILENMKTIYYKDGSKEIIINIFQLLTLTPPLELLV